MVLCAVGLSIAPVRAAASPHIDLITIDPGDAVWTRFGHVALRVVDPETGRDEAFNFGYAPFDQPDFLWGYLRGEAYFYLGSEPWPRVLTRYARYDRTVRRRRLNLGSDQEYLVAMQLEANARPENRDYQYDHLRDNCSTRVRDLLDAITSGALRRTAETRHPGTTYRHYTLEAGSGQILTQIVFDLIGGPNQEREVDGWMQLYLPRYLEEVVTETMVPGEDGELEPLAGPAEVLYRRRGPPPLSGHLYAGRWTVAAVGLAVGLFVFIGLRVTRRAAGRRSRFVGRGVGFLVLAVGLVFGFVGLALGGLVIVSRVPDFRWNENLIAFWPTDVLWTVTGVRWLVFGRRTVGRLFRGYAVARFAVLVALAVAKLVGVMPQDNWAFMTCAAFVLLGMVLGSRAPRRTNA